MVTGTSRVCRVNKDPQWLKEEDYGKFPGFCRTGIGIRFFFFPRFILRIKSKAHRIKRLAWSEINWDLGKGLLSPCSANQTPVEHHHFYTQCEIGSPKSCEWLTTEKNHNHSAFLPSQENHSLLQSVHW